MLYEQFRYLLVKPCLLVFKFLCHLVYSEMYPLVHLWGERKYRNYGGRRGVSPCGA